MLHGYGGNARSWVGLKPELPKIADEKGIIFVCPDGKNSWYWDSPKNQAYRYETSVASELVKHTDKNYATIPEKKGRAITGLSMGGHGALWLAIRHKEIFGAGGSTSGGVDIRPFPKNWEMNKQLGDYESDKTLWDQHTVITQVKTVEKDGYAAVQLGFQDKKEKHTTKPLMGHFKRAGVTPKRHLAEFKEFETELNLGDTVTVEMFNDANFVDVVGTSKGKGFQGVVKRHGFGGVGQATHGQHNRARKPGSIGACSYPAKVFKGMRMGGQLGGDRVTVQNLQVLKVIADHNLLLIKGSIPGCKGSIVLIEK